MKRAWRCWAGVACFLVALTPSRQSGGVQPEVPCTPIMRASWRLPGRVDSLLALPSVGVTVALVARSASDVPFLPHDDLLILAPNGRVRARVTVPPYTMPPGLAASTTARGTLYAVVDTALLAIDSGKGRIVARWTLDVQALGWPAAVALGAHGRIYVAGQPATGRAAVLDALTVTAQGRLRVVWRAPLGLTHAGLWLGLAGHGRVAAYLPDANDVHGTIALFDERSGTLRASYAVPVSPAGADAARDRLYLDEVGTIRALSLRDGAPVASVPGERPFALASSRGLLAFVRDDAIVLAAAGALRPLARIPLRDARTLAFTPDGATLLVARRSSLTRIDVGRCGAARRRATATAVAGQPTLGAVGRSLRDPATRP